MSATATATKIFADRIGRIEVSATMAITAAALKLKSEGVNLADFGAGEPHFSTPRHIKDAAIEVIENAITPKTKAIILNTPSNPSGAVVSPEDLEAIVRLAHKHGIFVLLDECYVYLNFTGEIVSGGTFTDCKEHVVVLGSLSKTYAMTGWRAGFAYVFESDPSTTTCSDRKSTRLNSSHQIIS